MDQEEMSNHLINSYLDRNNQNPQFMVDSADFTQIQNAVPMEYDNEEPREIVTDDEHQAQYEDQGEYENQEDVAPLQQEDNVELGDDAENQPLVEESPQAEDKQDGNLVGENRSFDNSGLIAHENPLTRDYDPYVARVSNQPFTGYHYRNGVRVEGHDPELNGGVVRSSMYVSGRYLIDMFISIQRHNIKGKM